MHHETVARIPCQSSRYHKRDHAGGGCLCADSAISPVKVSQGFQSETPTLPRRPRHPLIGCNLAHFLCSPMELGRMQRGKIFKSAQFAIILAAELFLAPF